MKRILTTIIYLTLVVSCKQELCDYNSLGENTAIRFTVDWSQSSIDPSNIYNLSMYGYPESGGSPYQRVSGDIESAYINLPAGFFNLMIFNDFVGDIAGLKFVDVDSYDQSYTSIVEQTYLGDIYYTPQDDEILATSHDKLAVWRVEGVEVTHDMVSCPYCGEIHIEELFFDASPTPITTECFFTLRVENLNNAQIIQGVVKGFAAGAYLSNGERISTPDKTTLYCFDYSLLAFDEDNKSGVVQAELTTFGKEPNVDQTYELNLDVILNNGKLVSFERDITDQVISQDNIMIEINLELDDEMISLPESSGTGFGVDAWGDRELIELL